MAKLEAIAAVRISHFHIDPFNMCRGRALVQLVNELLYGMLVALKMRLDTAVRSIPHPAGHTKCPRLFGCPGAEEDALHTSGHSNAAGGCHRQTVAMSGASSAFMPTTL